MRLNEKVTSGRDQWLQWHSEFASHAQGYIEVNLFTEATLIREDCLQASSSFKNYEHSIVPKMVFTVMYLKVWLQDDRRLQARIVDETKGFKEPVTVIRLKDKHHALDLWEGTCQTSADLTRQPPILLLPEGYEFADGQATILKDMGRLYKANELVSFNSMHCNVLFKMCKPFCRKGGLMSLKII